MVKRKCKILRSGKPSKGCVIFGKPTKGDYILKFKGKDNYHRVTGRSLLEAKAKMLKGTRYVFQDIKEKRKQDKC